MYLSNRSFNIPSGSPRGILMFGKLLFKFPPHRAEKLFKCPTPAGKLPGFKPFSSFYYIASIIKQCM